MMKLIFLFILINISVFAKEQLFKIDVIEIKSEYEVDKFFWLDFININPGDFVSNEKINSIKERILNTEEFSNVFIQNKIIDNQNKLIFYFTKEPVIKDIIIKGNFPLLESELKRKIFFRTGDEFDIKKIKDSKENIIELFEESGFFNAKVNITYQYSTDYQYVYIYVDIKNIGIELKTNKVFIDFKKDENYSNNKKILQDIEKILKPSKTEEIENGFTYSEFKKKMEDVRLFLQKEGYISAKIKADSLRTDSSENTELNNFQENIVEEPKEEINTTNKEKNISAYSDKIRKYYGDKIILEDKYLDIRKRGFVIDYKTRSVDLWVIVDLGPKVEFEFKGFDSLTIKEIKDNISLYSVGSVSPNEIKNSENKLKKYYQSIGYYFVEVLSESKKYSDKLLITFTAKENEKLLIRNIYLKGINYTKLSNSDLIKDMSTGIYNYLGSKGYLQESLFAKDLRDIISFYKKDGYLNAKVKDVYFEFYNDNKYIDITVEFEEGNQIKVKEIEIHGNNNFTTAFLEKQMQNTEKEGLDFENFAKNGRIIEQIYQSNGYPFAKVKRTIEIIDKNEFITIEPLGELIKSEEELYDKIKGDVKLIYEITEGNSVKFGEIFIKGNFETKLNTIKNEIRFKPGQLFNYEKIQETKDNIRGLGVFRLVNIKLSKIGETSEFTDVIISVEEDDNQYLDFSVGTSSDEKYSASSKFVEQNFFGWAKELSLLGKVGEIYNTAEVNFTDPRFNFFRLLTLFTNFTLGSNIKLFYRHETLPSFILDGYGGSISLFKTFFKKLNLSLSFEAEESTTERYFSNNIISPDIFTKIEYSTTTSIIFSLYLENRDNPFDPRRGSLLRFTTKYATRFNFLGPLGGGDEFFKWDAEYSHYFNFGNWFILAGSLRLGSIIPTNPERERIPEKERFFLGGDNTIRGYELNMVGPLENNNPIGDNSKLLGNLELRIPLRLISNIWLAFFIDAGGISGDITDFFESKTYDIEEDNKIKYSIGSGIRYMTIIGPIRLDVGYKLNREVWDKEYYKVHFNFSYPF